MNPHEDCGIFFDYAHIKDTPEKVKQLYRQCEMFFYFAQTHLVPEEVVQSLFPKSTPEQFIFLAHTLQDGILPENQHAAMRIFLKNSHLRHNHALHNPAIVQQEIASQRDLIYALAYVFSLHEYPANIPVKPLFMLFSDRARRHTLYYKIAHKSGLDDEQIDLLKFEVQQAYDTHDAAHI
jgi:hypothetical protein